MSWFNSHRKGDTVFLRIFNEVGEKGIGFPALAEAIGDAPKVELSVNSPGGCGRIAFNTFDLLRERNTRTLIDGIAGSAGAIIALAGQRIAMTRSSRMMVHAPIMAAIGDAAELRETAARLQEFEERFFRILNLQSEQPAELIREWLRKDTWFTAEEALTAGLVEEIIEPKPGNVIAIPLEDEPDDSQERLLLAMLDVFGDLQVVDKAKFARELNVWFAYRVKEGCSVSIPECPSSAV